VKRCWPIDPAPNLEDQCHEISGSDRSSVKYNPFVYMMLTMTLLCVLFSVSRPSMVVTLPHDRKELILLHEKHYYVYEFRRLSME